MAPPRDGPPSLLRLDAMDTPSVLECLRARSERGEVYTSAGDDMLVSVNPFKATAACSDAALDAAVSAAVGRGGGGDDGPPSAFSIGSRCWTRLLATHRSQAVVISGESGAGKTECAKMVFRALVGLSEHSSKHPRASLTAGDGQSSQRPSARVSTTHTSNIEARLLVGGLALEAFGNARTVRNDNSSRFGKYLSCAVDRKGRLAGARIITYLLERSRVVSQAPREAPFHVMGALAGAGYGSHLAAGSARAYVREAPPASEAGRLLRQITDRLSAAGVSKAGVNSIMSAAAAVLCLGEVSFEDAGNEGCTVNAGESARKLAAAAALLGKPDGQIAELLTERLLPLPGAERVTVKLSADAAAQARDATAKALYARVFEVLVMELNAGLAAGSGRTDATSVSVLDIFGFENFASNSLEQLLINYANEKLQGLCTSMLLAAEQAEYVEEGVPWTPIEFVDNEATLAAFERRAGLLGMLHEEATLQQGGDATLHGKLKAALNDDACFSMPSAAGARGQFVVKHFTGDAVVYDTQGMVEKARQTLPPDLEALLDDVLPLQREDAPTGGSAASGGGGIRASKRGSATGRKGNRRVGSTVLQFKAQLASLHSALAASQLSFVRCVKPNAANKPDCFDDEYCKPQVLAAGAAELARIRSAGWAVRLPAKDLAEKFSCVLGEGAPEDDNIALANADVGGARQAAEAVLRAGGVPAEQWCFGKATARVFVRDESAMEGLWAMRRAEMERRAEAARKAREEAERLERERQRQMTAEAEAAAAAAAAQAAAAAARAPSAEELDLPVHLRDLLASGVLSLPSSRAGGVRRTASMEDLVVDSQAIDLDEALVAALAFEEQQAAAAHAQMLLDDEALALRLQEEEDRAAREHERAQAMAVNGGASEADQMLWAMQESARMAGRAGDAVDERGTDAVGPDGIALEHAGSTQPSTPPRSPAHAYSQSPYSSPQAHQQLLAGRGTSADGSPAAGTWVPPSGGQTASVHSSSASSVVGASRGGDVTSAESKPGCCVIS